MQNIAAHSCEEERLLDAIVSDSGVDLRDCYQCGKCSAGCPVASHADMTCRQVIRSLQLGDVDTVLHSNMPWLCLSCATCVARCPQKVDMPSLMNAITRQGAAQGIIPVHKAKAFQDVFLQIVKQTGISNETLLAAGYNMTSGRLLQDVDSVPAMLKQGMLEVGLPKSIENPDEMKQIFERCKNAAFPSMDKTDEPQVKLQAQDSVVPSQKGAHDE